MNIDVLVSEVGPRDGLQSIAPVMPLEVKKAWIAAEAAAGVREVEVGSFVPAKLLPQLADTAEVVGFARSYSRSDGRRAGAEPEGRRGRGTIRRP
jgi:hydroxymethylglutaryl-CoA lyase